MTISFSKALGVHEQALVLRTQRTALLANNIANASTPGYKARDIDFQSILSQASNRNVRSVDVAKTNARHLGGFSLSTRAEAMYRVPTQASLDGNTVDEQIENAAFARNAIEHQASFQFLNSKFTGLMKALRGE
ncbi:MAG: flagellar basal body rod protein FlgB [Pseudohongiella sp.]|nr:flagellar basal body rod protein FlgB [Pseudohongiella sp.]MDP1756475.1 flagellar basal body rod protein FlgB [Pseudohongiella sp.]